jgi:hypothetical protein
MAEQAAWRAWDALLSWRSKNYQDEALQEVFARAAVDPRVEQVGKQILQIIDQGPPQGHDPQSSFLETLHATEVTSYYNSIAINMHSLVAMRWPAELAPLAENINSHVSYIENQVAKFEATDGAHEIKVPLAQLRALIEGYVRPVDVDSISEGARHCVYSLRRAIEWRRDELIDIFGYVMEAYHREHEAALYVGDKRAGPEPLFYPRIDDAEAKIEIWAKANAYLGKPWMQCRLATDFLLRAVLDTELLPLKREANDHQGVVAPFLRGAWWWRPVLSAFLGASVIYAVINGDIIFAIMAAALLGLLFYRAPKHNPAMSEIRETLPHLLGLLDDVRREVASGAYDAGVLSERLKRAETEGAVIPSIAFSLLKLRATQEQVTDSSVPITAISS